MKKYFVTIFAVLAVSAPFWGAGAATFSLVPGGDAVVGRQFSLAVEIRTEGQVLNAVSGEIIFPEDLLSVRSINDGDSMVSFWVEPPHEDGGKIVFSGIVPGGYYGDEAELFRVVFLPEKSGSGEVVFNRMMALLNDGAGTAVSVTALPWTLNVAPSETGAPSAPFTPSEEPDTDLPEPFTPAISSSPDIFDGAYFLVFKTQDKGSGIDHYEVAETRDAEARRTWRRAETPYLLDDQELKSRILVKAVDKEGNIRLAELAPPNRPSWYEIRPDWGIILSIAFAIAVLTILWRKAFRLKK